MPPRAAQRALHAALFVRAAYVYWLDVVPLVCRELKGWQRRAEAIPDEVLRLVARRTLDTKGDGIGGAAAFAAFGPRKYRPLLVRAITAFQAALDYVDTIGEMPNPDPIANGQALHRALLTVFAPGAPHPDYYALHVRDGDAGYLVALVDACRDAVTRLPSFEHIAPTSRRVVSRIIAYQSLNHCGAYGSRAAFAQWAGAQAAPGTAMWWWEVAAAAGSHLILLALMTAAADPRTEPGDVAALEAAYFPWVGALSTLLDGLVDQARDREEGQANLIDYYESPQEAASRLGTIAREAVAHVRTLPDAPNHLLLLAAMAAFFHTQARSVETRLVSRAVQAAMGPQARLALAIFSAHEALGKRARIPPSPLHHC